MSDNCLDKIVTNSLLNIIIWDNWKYFIIDFIPIIGFLELE